MNTQSTSTSTPTPTQQRDPRTNVAACELYCKLLHAKDNGLQWPKIRLSTYIFSLSRHPATVYVKHRDSGEYLGKIVGFKFYPATQWITTTSLSELDSIIRASLSSQLHAYGQKTGQCGCCGRTLTAADSIRNNIGPICAEKFGFKF